MNKAFSRTVWHPLTSLGFSSWNWDAKLKAKRKTYVFRDWDKTWMPVKRLFVRSFSELCNLSIKFSIDSCCFMKTYPKTMLTLLLFCRRALKSRSCREIIFKENSPKVETQLRSQVKSWNNIFVSVSWFFSCMWIRMSRSTVKCIFIRFSPRSASFSCKTTVCILFIKF